MTPLHIAIKIYEIAEEGAVTTVYRSNTPDIDLVDLFSGSIARVEPLLEELKQWKVQKDVSILPVMGRCLQLS